MPMQMGGGMESLTPSVFADVMAAVVSQTENTVMLDVEVAEARSVRPGDEVP